MFEASTVSAKAHLDLTEILVDGAKGRWSHVLLLDCLFWPHSGSRKIRAGPSVRGIAVLISTRPCVKR